MEDHNHHDHHHGCTSGHSMSFHAGFNEVLLLDSWTISSLTGLLYACVGIFIASVLYEGLKSFRQYLQVKPLFSKKHHCHKSSPSEKAIICKHCPSNPAELAPTITPPTDFKSCKCGTTSDESFLDHLVQTLIHMLQVCAGLVLMLVFMTYNYWLCLSLVLGSGFGYLLFGRLKHPTIDKYSEHCNFCA